jgi:hypothetical protein
MRSRLTVILIFTFLLIYPSKLIAQDDLSLSIFYKYAHNFERGRPDYFLGFGSSLSKNISKKLILSTGLDYSYYFNEYQMRITPPITRSKEIFKESIYSLDIGLSYPILDKTLAIKVGSSLVPTYFHNSFDFKRYLVSNDSLDLYFKTYRDYFSLGLKAKLDFEYSINNKICLLIQTGYIYYLTGDYKDKFFTCSAGLKFIL